MFTAPLPTADSANHQLKQNHLTEKSFCCKTEHLLCGDTHIISHPLPPFSQPLFLTTHLPLSAHPSTHQPWMWALNRHGSAPSLPPSLPRWQNGSFQGKAKPAKQSQKLSFSHSPVWPRSWDLKTDTLSLTGEYAYANDFEVRLRDLNDLAKF